MQEVCDSIEVTPLSGALGAEIHGVDLSVGLGDKQFAQIREAFQGRIANAEQATQDAVHPMVITHPDTGRKALYVNPTFTVRVDGWSVEESQALLGYLYEHAARPEFTCRFRWRRHSLAVWDNRAAWHYALNDYPGQRRLMHRITVEGVPLS